MAENITVDELAIKLSANADAASLSLKNLAETVEVVAGKLAPLEKTLQTVTNMLRASKGSERALTQALKSTGTSATAAANDTEKAANRIARAYTKVASMQGKFTAVPFVAPTLSAPTTPNATATTIPTASTATTKRVGLVGGAVDKLKAKFAGMETTGTKAVKNVGMSFVQLRSWVFFAMFAITGITATLGVFVKGAMDYYEQMHLFGTVFGPLAEEANKYADSISNALGIDPVAFKKTYATFFEMARAMNISSDAANTMSKNFTQLTYDYASLFDMDFDTVFEKFRSAMAGQTRSIHQFGLDVTIAALQEEAYKEQKVAAAKAIANATSEAGMQEEAWREGITQSVSEMSKANKAILMHNAILRNSTRAQGDLARTITQPANMLRIMKDQFTVLARTIGFLFMPALQAILPWLITLAQVLNKVAQQFLALFGIKMPDWKSFTASAAAAGQGTDDLFSDAVDGANAAKEALKDYTMGFDELHIINPASSSGGSGSGASAGGGGATIAPFDVYDMVGGIDALAKIVDPVIEKFRVLGDVFAPFIDALKKLWDAFVPFAENVWDGFKSFYTDVLVPLAVWTMNEVGVWLVERLTAALQWFNDHPDVAKKLGEIAGMLTVVGAVKIGLTGLEKLAGLLARIFSMRNIQLTITVAGLTWLFSKPEVQDYLDTWSKKPWAFDKEAITDLGHTWADFLGLNKQGVDDCKQSWIDLGIQLGFTKDGFDEWKESWITFFGVSKDDIEDWKKSWQQFGIDLGFSKQGVEDWKKSWEPVTNMFKNIVSAAKTAWDNLGNGLESAWNHIKSTFKNGVNDIIRLINNGPIELINKLISAANNLPGNPFTIQKIQTISYLAQGGMPTLGSMFVAGEAGPELIGSYGGNPNTVMPLAESGFVEAMAAATFSAVSQAMKNAGGAGGSGDVYLDGVKVGEITQRSMMRAGKTGSLVSVRS